MPIVMCLWDTWRINHKGNVCMFRVGACLYRLGCWEFLLKPLLYIPKRVASAILYQLLLITLKKVAVH